MKNEDLKNINTNEINRDAWDAYQEDYMKANLLAKPDYYEFYSKGGSMLDDYEPMISLMGDVKGLKLLATCCACDASQAFSWHNLGAKVTATDITPRAIEIAKKNAEIMNLDVEFVIADMQKLDPIADGRFDIVFAQYPYWIQDFFEACRTWNRVLKKSGRLLLVADHPITDCIEEDGEGLHIVQNYNKPSADWSDTFGGTPLADRHLGGWSVDLPCVGNFWRISDLLNAICDADFRIIKVHEGAESGESQIQKLPNEFFVLAVKQ